MNNILKSIIDGTYHNTKETVELYLPQQYESPNDIIMRILYLLNKNQLQYVISKEISNHIDKNDCYYDVIFQYEDGGLYWVDYIIRFVMHISTDEPVVYTFSSSLPDRYDSKKDYKAKCVLCEQTQDLVMVFNTFIDGIIQNILKLKKEYTEENTDPSETSPWHKLYVDQQLEDLDKYSNFLQQLKISKEELV